ncbi:MAG: hotdog fold thioesterase [Acidimicrobiia bacterium]
MSGFTRTGLQEMLDADPYAQSLGIVLIAVSDDEIVVGLDVRPDHLNFFEVGHGGMVFSLADCAFSLASNAVGDRAVAVDAHLAFTAASRSGDRLEARVTEMSRGRTLGTYRVDVKRDDGKVVGLFTGTVHITPSA